MNENENENEKEAEEFKEFKDKIKVIMERDLKKIIKSYHDLPKTEYMVVKELVEINPMKDVLRTVYLTAFLAGIKRAGKECNKGKEKL